MKQNQKTISRVITWTGFIASIITIYLFFHQNFLLSVNFKNETITDTISYTENNEKFHKQKSTIKKENNQINKIVSKKQIPNRLKWIGALIYFSLLLFIIFKEDDWSFSSFWIIRNLFWIFMILSFGGLVYLFTYYK